MSLPAPAAAAGRMGRIPSHFWISAAAVAVCLLLNAILLMWIAVGPPIGKSNSFFVELVVVVGGGLALTIGTILYPQRAQLAMPVVLLLLAWHTGFQITLVAGWPGVLTAFDVLVPAVLAIGFVGRWYEGSIVSFTDRRLWNLYLVFLGFALWGLAIGLVRGVDMGALLQNMKAFVLYPLIVPLVLWCIRSWRQLFWTTAVMLALITERALEGLRQSQAITSGSPTALVGNQVVVRATGAFASANQYALYLVSGLVLLVAIIVAIRRWPARLGLGVCVALIAYSTVLTLSRGAWVAMGVALLPLLVFLPRKRAIGVLSSVVVVAGLIAIVHPDAISLVTTRFGFSDSSTTQRLDYVGLGRSVIAAYPLGAGWGANFVQTLTGLQADHINWPWYHNDYIQLATEVGIAGLAVFLWIWFVILRMGVRAAREIPDRLRKALTVGLVGACMGMLFQAGTDQVFWRSDIAPHVWIVAGLLATAACLARRDRETESQAPPAVTAEHRIGHFHRDPTTADQAS